MVGESVLLEVHRFAECPQCLRQRCYLYCQECQFPELLLEELELELELELEPER